MKSSGQPRKQLYSANEWDPLKAVLVGTTTGYLSPLSLPEASTFSDALLAQQLAKQAFPKSYLEEVEEDLAGFRLALETLGIDTYSAATGIPDRPKPYCTPYFTACGNDTFNIRDRHLIVGNRLITSPATKRGRFFEGHSVADFLYKEYFDSGFSWINAPTPRLRGKILFDVDKPLTTREREEDFRQKELGNKVPEKFRMLTEDEILFDAANICRLGSDILYLISCSGNEKGAKWLQSALGGDHRVHLTDTYRSSHLDSTIIPIREGLVLLNALRVGPENCPKVLDGWEKIYFSEVEPVPRSEIDFHEEYRIPVGRRLSRMGIENQLECMTSPWIGLNLLVIRPGLVMVTNPQPRLCKELLRYGVDTIEIGMRHAYTMLGGLHCCTLDLERSYVGI